jgi:hypothetical protein
MAFFMFAGAIRIIFAAFFAIIAAILAGLVANAATGLM